MSDISIEEYNEKDRNSCIDLLSSIFRGTSDEKTFSWRFESPSRQSPLIVVAKDKNMVISFNSWIVWGFVHNNVRYFGYQSGESATCEGYRRLGIWGKVLRYADEIARGRNIDFFYGFPSTMSYHAFYSAGYIPIGTFNYCFRLINPFIKSTAEKTDYKYDDLPPKLLYEKNRITPVIDSNYFEWRYSENPKRYDVIKYHENNNQAVFIVRKGDYYNKKYGIRCPELLLLDCHFTSYNDIFIANAIKHLDRVYSRKVFYIKTFLNTQTDRGRALMKHFPFRPKSRVEILCVKVIKSNMDHTVFSNCNNWDIFPHVIDEM